MISEDEKNKLIDAVSDEVDRILEVLGDCLDTNDMDSYHRMLEQLRAIESNGVIGGLMR